MPKRFKQQQEVIANHSIWLHRSLGSSFSTFIIDWYWELLVFLIYCLIVLSISQSYQQVKSVTCQDQYKNIVPCPPEMPGYTPPLHSINLTNISIRRIVVGYFNG